MSYSDVMSTLAIIITIANAAYQLGKATRYDGKRDGRQPHP